MCDSSLPVQPSPRPTQRASLACVQCRSRHMKCDGSMPVCSRCQLDGKQCIYLKSRRGGRRRTAASQAASPIEPLRFDESIFNAAGGMSVADSTRPPSVSMDRSASIDFNPFTPTQTRSSSATADDLVDSYYTFFHPAHPCVVPQWSLNRRQEQNAALLEPLLVVMRYIGSLFTSLVPSAPLEEQVLQVLSARRAQETPQTGFQVQALILYTIAVYWCNDTDRALGLLNEVIRMAVGLGMHLEDFATQHGDGDPVLKESWRRTWWQIYDTDAHIARSTHTSLKASFVEPSVALPCEDDCYQSGVSCANTTWNALVSLISPIEYSHPKNTC